MTRFQNRLKAKWHRENYSKDSSGHRKKQRTLVEEFNEGLDVLPYAKDGTLGEVLDELYSD